MDSQRLRSWGDALRRPGARTRSYEAPGAGAGKGNGNGRHGVAAHEPTRFGSRHLLDFLSCCQTPISRVLSHDVVFATPQLSIEGLTALLLDRGIDAVPVLEKGRLVGVVSTADALREHADRDDGEEHYRPRWASRRGVYVEPGDGFHETTLARATVREIMTPFPLALPATASVAQAAALMTAEAVDQIPVVDSGLRLVGIVTAQDVMRWLANQSGFLLPAADRGNGHGNGNGHGHVGADLEPSSATDRRGNRSQ